MVKVIIDPNGNKHEIVIDDDLAFLAPYITPAKRLGVPVWRIREIKGYFVQPGKLEQQSAATLKDANKKLVVTILKKHQVWTSKNGKFEVSHYLEADKSYFFEFSLDSFAHELSHLTHWDHTADRMVLEKKIAYSFACLARKRGYTGYDRS